MSRLRLIEVAEPNSPAATKGELFYSSASERVCFKNDEGFLQTISPNGLRDINFITNGSMAVQQRVAVASTAIPSVSATTRAGRVADRWAVTVGNVTTPSWQQVDSGGAPETNLLARYYGKITQATNAAKWILSQYITNADMTCLRGQQVRVSCKIKRFVGSDAAINLGLLYLAAAGTGDTDPTFISAIGADGTDPTWGTNLVLCTPVAGVEAENATVVGNKIQATSTANWLRISGVFSVPVDAENLVVVLYRNTAGAANDAFGATEFQLTSGAEIIDWVTMPAHIDLGRCLRHFQKSFPQGVVPAASVAVATGGHGATGILGKSGSGTALGSQITIQFVIPMFKVPTMTLFTPITTGALVYRYSGTTPAAQGTTAVLTSSTTDRGCVVTATNEATTNGAVGDLVGVHYTADAEFVA